MLAQIDPAQINVEILPLNLVADISPLEGELDEMWSFVEKKENQRWLWHGIDHKTGKVLA